MYPLNNSICDRVHLPFWPSFLFHKVSKSSLFLSTGSFLNCSNPWVKLSILASKSLIAICNSFSSLLSWEIWSLILLISISIIPISLSSLRTRSFNNSKSIGELPVAATSVQILFNETAFLILSAS
ncbi:MAG: hypothetical protein I3270_01595 [Candidatus Moeniiplasma glomeromycotorum]|nr:hypothetical protein [Candidatus Moeniiplasma glomeromycotorum]MCE8162400.1 hypothetical protein [Candidatus Moeniiplasma glomeromycotorum]MCE8166326.1 hypothetical protein [Candidatus Moeniiplasma glomeromycotorum]MCE8166808.1 hypothetical protein [Candidatus Moeniiplasma glomeromycotorum]